jgi:Phosphotransferase enzyme family
MWDDDGFAFFAQHRLLRWLGQPRVEAALDPADRAALERLCHRLPDLLPDRPACLTHGGPWAQNILATPDGQPALIDPCPIRRLIAATSRATTRRSRVSARGKGESLWRHRIAAGRTVPHRRIGTRI